ncbi:hypothetical protein HDU98_009779 [Podochytrium sp. JEL0797]|nr:hypothetical protein HDU98_009779 [Podochytrium sp. JEL0797]
MQSTIDIRRHPFQNRSFKPLTLRERRYILALGEVLKTPNWDKLKPEQIEQIAAANSRYEHLLVDYPIQKPLPNSLPKMMWFLNAELAHIRRDLGRGAVPLPAVGLSIKDELLKEVEVVRLTERVAALSDRWVGQDQVRNLIDVTNYPLVSHRSFASDCANAVFGDRLVVDSKADFQWLPARFEVNERGKVAIESYINNLPRLGNEVLYEFAAGIFKRMLPQFENAVASLNVSPPRRIAVDMRNVGAHKDKTYSLPTSFDGSSKSLVQPLARPTTGSLNGKTLQVIFRIVDIHLTDSQPEYKGSDVYHVEGLAQEAIAATGIYYLHVENITESRLTYRQQFEVPYQAIDNPPLAERVFGVRQHTSKTAHIVAQTTAIANRAVVFPNFYPHKMEPFTRLDASKPGRRTALIYFLVHPGISVMDTSNVPEQQLEVVIEKVADLFGTRLPFDVCVLIALRLPHISPKQAVELRSKATAFYRQKKEERGREISNLYLRDAEESDDDMS